jgi:hypothetical protein
MPIEWQVNVSHFHPNPICRQKIGISVARALALEHFKKDRCAAPGHWLVELCIGGSLQLAAAGLLFALGCPAQSSVHLASIRKLGSAGLR